MGKVGGVRVSRTVVGVAQVLAALALFGCQPTELQLYGAYPVDAGADLELPDASLEPEETSCEGGNYIGSFECSFEWPRAPGLPFVTLSGPLELNLQPRLEDDTLAVEGWATGSPTSPFLPSAPTEDLEFWMPLRSGDVGCPTSDLYLSGSELETVEFFLGTNREIRVEMSLDGRRSTNLDSIDGTVIVEAGGAATLCEGSFEAARELPESAAQAPALPEPF